MLMRPCNTTHCLESSLIIRCAMGQVNGSWLVTVEAWVWSWTWDLWRKKWHLDGVFHSTSLYPVNNIPSTFHTHSFMYDQCCMILAIDSVTEYHTLWNCCSPMQRQNTVKRLIRILPGYTEEVMPWSEVLQEKLLVSQLVWIFPAFNGIERFVTMFRRACHLFLSRDMWI